MTYQEKLLIANNYLNDKLGLDWDDLPDINSLHDADTQEEIYELCEARLIEEGFGTFESEEE